MNFRYLTFEVNADCPLADLHRRCPVSDPQRYRFGSTARTIDAQAIMDFWRWARSRGFAGTVLWHLYNEPAVAEPAIQVLMAAMRAEVPGQQFHLWTARKRAFQGFDHVVVTDYAAVRPGDLDNRRAAMEGEGDYAMAPQAGECGRSAGWELIIDHHGNWLRCCSDWQCEEAIGNIFGEGWDELLARYEGRPVVKWHDAATFAAQPRLCRACVTVNPTLHRTALPPPGL